MFNASSNSFWRRTRGTEQVRLYFWLCFRRGCHPIIRRYSSILCYHPYRYRYRVQQKSQTFLKRFDWWPDSTLFGPCSFLCRWPIPT